MRGEFRVNSGAWKTVGGADTATPGCTITYQASGSVNRGQPLADPLPPGRRTLNKNRHIRAQGKSQGGELRQ